MEYRVIFRMPCPQEPVVRIARSENALTTREMLRVLYSPSATRQTGTDPDAFRLDELHVTLDADQAQHAAARFAHTPTVTVIVHAPLTAYYTDHVEKICSANEDDDGDPYGVRYVCQHDRLIADWLEAGAPVVWENTPDAAPAPQHRTARYILHHGHNKMRHLFFVTPVGLQGGPEPDHWKAQDVSGRRVAFVPIHTRDGRVQQGHCGTLPFEDEQGRLAALGKLIDTMQARSRVYGFRPASEITVNRVTHTAQSGHVYLTSDLYKTAA